MDIDLIRALFDKEQRIEVLYPGVRREVTPDLVRHVSTRADGDGFIIYPRLDSASVDPTIRAQVAYFEQIGQDFEWKVYDYDTPPDLKERLVTHGFEVEEPEAVMVLDAQAAPPALLQPPPGNIRRVIDPERTQDVVAVEEQVWQEDFSDLGKNLAEVLREQPESLSVYLAYAEGKPVASAWMFYHAGSQFASLWGGSTLPEYRRQGLYSGLLAARLQEALHRQVRFLTVDASPMSRPILEKFGFQKLANAVACKWRVKQKGMVSKDQALR